MKYLYFPFLFGFVLILQSAVVPVILPGWFVDGFDLPLIITLHVAMTRGKIPGMMAGLVIGYFQDAMSGGVLGFNGVSKIIAGYMGGYLKEKFFVRSMAHRTASVAGAVFMALLGKAAILALFAQPRPSLLSTQFLWGFVGNTLFALLIHALLDRFEAAFGIRAEEELSLGG
jgi:rod shape-determining protein MreD